MNFLIIYYPFTYEENANDEIYKCFSEPEYEYHTDESEFLFRCRELESTSGEYKPHKWCDGIDVESYYVDLTPYKR